MFRKQSRMFDYKTPLLVGYVWGVTILLAKRFRDRCFLRMHAMPMIVAWICEILCNALQMRTQRCSCRFFPPVSWWFLPLIHWRQIIAYATCLIYVGHLWLHSSYVRDGKPLDTVVFSILNMFAGDFHMWKKHYTTIQPGGKLLPSSLVAAYIPSVVGQ